MDDSAKMGMLKPIIGMNRRNQLVARRSVAVLLALAFIASPIFARAPLQDYALLLQDEPVVMQIRSRAELRSGSARRRLQFLSASQNRLQTVLERRRITVTGSVQILINAVFVRVTADRLHELRALPGVRAVALLPHVRRHLDQAVQLVGVPDAWNTAGGVGNAGAGVRSASSIPGSIRPTPPSRTSP